MPSISNPDMRRLIDQVRRTPGFQVIAHGHRQEVRNLTTGERVFLKTGASGLWQPHMVARLLKGIGWIGMGGDTMTLPPSGGEDLIRVVVSDEELAQLPDEFRAELELHNTVALPRCDECGRPDTAHRLQCTQHPDYVDPASWDNGETDPEPEEDLPQPTALQGGHMPHVNPGQSFLDAALEHLMGQPECAHTIEEIVDAIGTHGLKRASCGPAVSQAWLQAADDDLWLHVKRTKGQRPIRYWWDGDDPRDPEPRVRVARGQATPTDYEGTFAEAVLALPDGDLLLRMEDGSIWQAKPLRSGK